MILQQLPFLQIVLLCCLWPCGNSHSPWVLTLVVWCHHDGIAAIWTWWWLPFVATLLPRSMHHGAAVSTEKQENVWGGICGAGLIYKIKNVKLLYTVWLLVRRVNYHAVFFLTVFILKSSCLVFFVRPDKTLFVSGRIRTVSVVCLCIHLISSSALFDVCKLGVLVIEICIWG